MKAMVQKWGNSLAIRIPKSIASLTKLSQNSAVELTLSKGSLVITRSRKQTEGKIPEYNLKDLLKKVRKDNLHEAIETGPAVGKEIW